MRVWKEEIIIYIPLYLNASFWPSPSHPIHPMFIYKNVSHITEVCNLRELFKARSETLQPQVAYQIPVSLLRANIILLHLLYLDLLEMVLKKTSKTLKLTFWKINSYELVYETLNKQSHKVQLSVGAFDISSPILTIIFASNDSENSDGKSISFPRMY